MKNTIKIKFFGVDKRYQQRWKFYTFNPCSCGCTKTSGWGITFEHWGFLVETKKYTREELTNIFGLRLP